MTFTKREILPAVLLCLGVLAAILVSQPAPSASAATAAVAPRFPDAADGGSWAVPSINYAADRGITVGTTINGVTYFQPRLSVNRGQMITFLYRASGSPSVRGNHSFIDIDSDPSVSGWLPVPATWGQEQGVISGVETGTGPELRPNEAASRLEVVVYLHRLAGSPATANSAAFNDWSPGDSRTAWADAAVAWAACSGVLQGAAGSLNPHDAVTRAEAVTLIHRTLEPSVRPAPIACVGLHPVESIFQDSLNEHRTSRGLAPLSHRVDHLPYSRDWSNTMLAAGTISHDSFSDGHHGENVFSTTGGAAVAPARAADQMLDAFLDSPGHRENIERQEFVGHSIGIAIGDGGTMYATSRFFRDR